MGGERRRHAGRGDRRGEQTLTAKPPLMREGPEWDRLHAAAVAYWPDILEYQTHTTRTFPFIVLDPIPDPARPR